MLQSKSLCGVTLQYNIEGDGYPVILMHGWGCNHTTVQSIERLLSPHFKVYNLGTLSGDGYLSYTPHETKPIKLFWLMLPGLNPNAH